MHGAMNKDIEPRKTERKTTTQKIKNVTVNINSNFQPVKDLSEILFTIVNARLQEKPATI